MERAGLVDGVSATFPDGVSGLIVIGAPSPRRRRTYATQRRLWDRLLPHLATGWRLRRRLEQGTADDPQAVLTPSGEVAYAVGRAATLEGRVALARAVVQAETARGPLRRADPEVALDLWRGLVSGRWSLVDRVESDGRRFIVAYQNPAGLIDPRRLSEREDAVATLASRGVPLKQIAYTLGLSAGTVAAYLGAALRKLGVAGRVELARLGHLRESEALELAVATAEAGGAATAAEPAGQRLVAVEEPGITSDDGLLGRGERRVATLSASGLSNDEIARLLDRSPKTIANQLASIFAKLGVGSRAALAHRLSQRRRPASSD
ncbi:MAG: helix-turn-helix transcriptional regulator [Myxococcota bacterium]